jgi:glutamate dehydrogenase
MSAHNDVADIIVRLREIAAERRTNDSLLQSFLGVYYRDVPSDDADSRRLNAAYAAALAHLQLGRVRRVGETLVDVLSPDLERDGWETERTILMFVTDDVPFLVDSVRMVLDRFRLGIHLLVHPMLTVRRNDRHELVDVEAAEGRVEAWTLIELDRCPPGLRDRLEAEVRAAIDDVQSVVGDFAAMQERLGTIGADDALLQWLARENFIFLGSAIYDRSTDGLVVRPGSLLGQYRSGRLDAGHVDPPPHHGDRVVVIARTDAVATVHRPVRMTSIAVRPTGSDEEIRFVGLLGSAAYRQSVFAIPTISERADQVVATVGAAVESHTGRAVRNVIETLPRDVVFEASVEELTDLVAAISGLQERRIVRVFDVSEPVGPWTTVLAYVPQSRFTAALPELVAALVSEYYGGEIRDLETLVGSSSLARISMTVRSGMSIDNTRLVASIDRASRTWGERANDALVELLGEVEGHRVWAEVGPTVPADYEARVRPEAAVGDLVNVEAMLTGTHPIATSFGRSIDAVDGEWRFKVFLRDRSTTIAELVPILEHLGLPPLDEHPSEFVGPSATVHLDDIGVRLGVHGLDDAQHAEVQRAFVDLMTGAGEPDGLNRLVLSAGLQRRQIAYYGSTSGISARPRSRSAPPMSSMRWSATPTSHVVSPSCSTPDSIRAWLWRPTTSAWPPSSDAGARCANSSTQFPRSTTIASVAPSSRSSTPPIEPTPSVVERRSRSSCDPTTSASSPSPDPSSRSSCVRPSWKGCTFEVVESLAAD